MTLHEIEDVLKRIEGIRAETTLQWERMEGLSLEAQGYSPKEIAVSLSRRKEEYNRKNINYMSVMRRCFKYDSDRAREIVRAIMANDKRVTELDEVLCA